MIATHPTEEQSALFRQLMANLPTSVTVIATETDEGRAGLVVGTFNSVSLDPLLVSFMPSATSGSWQRIRRQGRFTASILASDQKDVCQRLASRSSEKFEFVDLLPNDRGSVVVAGCVAWFDCDIVDVFPAGDHDIVLGSPRTMELNRAAAHPLVFFRRAYHRTFQVEDLVVPGWA